MLLQKVVAASRGEVEEVLGRCGVVAAGIFGEVVWSELNIGHVG